MLVSSQLSPTGRRGYQKTKRAEDEQRTRGRVVDAAEALHQTLGPARTTVSAIAEQAGVTRATVYRHFPDEESLFVACSRQWLSRQRLPDPEAWTAQHDPAARLRVGLADIYRYYRTGEKMLTQIHRDAHAVPEPVRQQRLLAQQRWVDTLLQPYPGASDRTLRAAIGHATAFGTWRSLCVDHDLSNRGAVDLMAGLVGFACVETSRLHPAE